MVRRRKVKQFYFFWIVKQEQSFGMFFESIEATYKLNSV